MDRADETCEGINFKKSGCLRVGSRCDITCAAIASSDGCSLPWVSELRYDTIR